LNRLLSLEDKSYNDFADLTEEEVVFLCSKAGEILLSESNVLVLNAPLTIVGDVHGQYQDLLRIFKMAKYPPHERFLFLGDYIDRGLQSIETICLLFALKIKYPDQIYLLRGNHECSYINRIYGFYDEVVRTYTPMIWNLFCKTFNNLPISATIDKKIFCIHGGISPELSSLEDIEKINRPTEVPESGLLCDLLWADPNQNPDADDYEDSDRGTSYMFSLRPAEQFLHDMNFDLICRAHQAIMDGHEFSFPNSQAVLTLFSAPNYCNEFQNKGAIMHVDPNLYCTFHILEPMDWDIVNFVPPRDPTPPRESLTGGPNLDSFEASSY